MRRDAHGAHQNQLVREGEPPGGHTKSIGWISHPGGHGETPPDDKKRKN